MGPGKVILTGRSVNDWAICQSEIRKFARALTEKLFAYALGHPLSFQERLIADDIAHANLENSEGFRDLILDICASPLFRGQLNSDVVAQN